MYTIVYLSKLLVKRKSFTFGSCLPTNVKRYQRLSVDVWVARSLGGLGGGVKMTILIYYKPTAKNEN